VKGTDVDFPKQHIAKNTVPAAYLDYLMQKWAKADDADNREGYVDRKKYNEYGEEMEKKRARKKNHELTAFDSG
jgi:hypothetical protein